MNYPQEMLDQLHTTLYEILGEIIRVCDVLHIPYFLQGGSGIGVFFFEAIVPWDDDVDVGMKRADYERFLREAPAVLGDDYFLDWLGTDPHTPHYFAKVRKNSTTFLEPFCQNLDIHHGIYVDVFPFDRVPDNPRKQQRQRKLVQLSSSCLVAKELWMWPYFGKSLANPPLEMTFLTCLLTRLVKTFVPKIVIYRVLRHFQTMYNDDSSCTYYNIVLTSVDHIAAVSLDHLQEARFGSLTVMVPNDLETYLRRHYPRLRKYLTEEEIAASGHMPQVLSFTEGDVRHHR